MNLTWTEVNMFSLFLNLDLFWMNKKAIIEFGFRRIMQIEEGVIHLGRSTSICIIIHILLSLIQ